MKLAPLAAGIDTGGQLAQKIGVEPASHKPRVELFRIEAVSTARKPAANISRASWGVSFCIVQMERGDRCLSPANFFSVARMSSKNRSPNAI